MANTLLHYQIGKRILEKIKLDKDMFTLGNIIPDAGKQLSFMVYLPDTYTTHYTHNTSKSTISPLKFLSHYLPKAKNAKEIAFIFGYYAHLISDKLFVTDYIFKIMDKYNLSHDDFELVKILKEEWSSLDYDYFYNNYDELEKLKYLDTNINIIDYYNSNDYNYLITKIFNTANYKKCELKYTDLKELNSFIDNVSNIIIKDLSHWLNPKDYKYLLIDLDQTIFDFKLAEKLSLPKAFELNDILVSEKLLKTYEEVNGSLWRAIEEGTFDKRNLEKTRFTKTLELLNMDKSKGIKIGQDYADLLSKCPFYLDGVEEALKELSKIYKIELVTNGFKHIQGPRVHNSTLINYLDKEYVSETIGFEKPDINYFNYVINDLKASNTEMLMIGDSLTSDMKGADNANIDALWISNKYNSNYFNLESLKYLPLYLNFKKIIKEVL